MAYLQKYKTFMVDLTQLLVLGVTTSWREGLGARNVDMSRRRSELFLVWTIGEDSISSREVTLLLRLGTLDRDLILLQKLGTPSRSTALSVGMCNFREGQDDLVMVRPTSRRLALQWGAAIS